MPPPILVFDSQEHWFPVGVEESVRHYGYGWRDDTFVHDHTGPVSRLNFPPDMRQPADLRPVGYHRVVAGGHLWWHQYWLWYLYNPKSYLGQGVHEGDWETIHIGCVDKAGDRPVLVTGSQHHTGAKHEAWRAVSKAGRMVVYVARGSHANYFTPTADLEDVADGKGRVLGDVTWREFGPWAAWPGVWGNSGNSPRSPGLQEPRWSRPHVYHGTSR